MKEVYYVFLSGTSIKASEMNANFDKLSAKIVELRSLIQNNSRKIVGVSNQTMNGAQGIIAMNKACEETFTGSVMCTTDHLLNSTKLISSKAWIHPVMAVNHPGNGGGYYYYDTSGYASTYSMNCSGWSDTDSSNSPYGRTILGGRSSQKKCDTELPIACCK